MIKKNAITTSLPVLAMRGVVVFPKMTLHFDVGRQKSLSAIRAALNTTGEIFLTAQVDADIENPEFSDLNKIGVVAEVKPTYILMEVDANVKIRVDKGSIVKDVTDIPAK